MSVGGRRDHHDTSERSGRGHIGGQYGSAAMRRRMPRGLGDATGAWRSACAMRRTPAPARMVIRHTNIAVVWPGRPVKNWVNVSVNNLIHLPHAIVRACSTPDGTGTPTRA